jgi:three-Cys-motif partner protein
MAMNRTALWREADRVHPDDVARMSRFWGDESWRDIAYQPPRQANLFGDGGVEKQSNDAMVDAFRKRLREVAGFSHVPRPIPMRGSQNAVIYCLFFASHNETGARIASDIFRRHASSEHPHG